MGWVRGIVNKKVVNLLRKTADELLSFDSQAATFLECCLIALSISNRHTAVRYFVQIVLGIIYITPHIPRIPRRTPPNSAERTAQSQVINSPI